MSNLETAKTTVTEVANQISTIAAKYGPTVVEAALWIGKIEAAKGLLTGFLFTTVFYISYRIFKWGFTFCEEDGDDLKPFLAMLFGGFFGVISFFVSIHHLFQIWYWVGIFRPDLFLAAKALKLL